MLSGMWRMMHMMGPNIAGTYKVSLRASMALTMEVATRSTSANLLLPFRSDALWDVANDAHDGSEYSRDIQSIFASVDGFDDGGGDAIHVGEFVASFHSGSHGGLHGSG